MEFRRVLFRSGEMRCANQLAFGRVGPAVQRANDVARAMARALVVEAATAVQHDRLAVSAHIGNQFHLPLCIAHQGAPLGLLGQGEVVTNFGHGQLMPHITRALAEEDFQFSLEQRLIEITGNW